jgi:hypothetical protein
MPPEMMQALDVETGDELELIGDPHTGEMTVRAYNSEEHALEEDDDSEPAE